MESAGVPLPVQSLPHTPSGPPKPVGKVMEIQGQDLLDRCKQTPIPDLPITFSHRDPTVCIPGVVIRFVALSVLLRLDRPHKWRVALERGWVPQGLVEWLGVSHLESLAEEARVDWLPYGVWMNALTDEVGKWLIQVRQPRPRAVIRETIRQVLLHAHAVHDGGVVMGGRYWKRFLRDQAKPLAPKLYVEVRERIQAGLGQLEVAELAPRHWMPVPELSAPDRAKLEAAVVSEAPERIQGLEAAFDAELFDFIADVLASTYSVLGRRAYHPVFLSACGTHRQACGRWSWRWWPRGSWMRAGSSRTWPTRIMCACSWA